MSVPQDACGISVDAAVPKSSVDEASIDGGAGQAHVTLRAVAAAALATARCTGSASLASAAVTEVWRLAAMGEIKNRKPGTAAEDLPVVSSKVESAVSSFSIGDCSDSCVSTQDSLDRWYHEAIPSMSEGIGDTTDTIVAKDGETAKGSRACASDGDTQGSGHALDYEAKQGHLPRPPEAQPEGGQTEGGVFCQLPWSPASELGQWAQRCVEAQAETFQLQIEVLESKIAGLETPSRQSKPVSRLAAVLLMQHSWKLFKARRDGTTGWGDKLAAESRQGHLPRPPEQSAGYKVDESAVKYPVASEQARAISWNLDEDTSSDSEYEDADLANAVQQKKLAMRQAAAARRERKPG